MPQLLIRLCYSSRLVSSVTEADLDEIVRRAAAKNLQLGSTGMLAVEGVRICQIIEGPRAEVIHLFRTIENDRRHEGVIELSCRPIEFRAFAKWGMTRRSMADAAMVAFASSKRS